MYDLEDVSAVKGEARLERGKGVAVDVCIVADERLREGVMLVDDRSPCWIGVNVDVDEEVF